MHGRAVQGDGPGHDDPGKQGQEADVHGDPVYGQKRFGPEPRGVGHRQVIGVQGHPREGRQAHLAADRHLAPKGLGEGQFGVFLQFFLAERKSYDLGQGEKPRRQHKAEQGGQAQAAQGAVFGRGIYGGLWGGDGAHGRKSAWRMAAVSGRLQADVEKAGGVRTPLDLHDQASRLLDHDQEGPGRGGVGHLHGPALGGHVRFVEGGDPFGRVPGRETDHDRLWKVDHLEEGGPRVHRHHALEPFREQPFGPGRRRRHNHEQGAERREYGTVHATSGHPASPFRDGPVVRPDDAARSGAKTRRPLQGIVCKTA